MEIQYFLKKKLTYSPVLSLNHPAILLTAAIDVDLEVCSLLADCQVWIQNGHREDKWPGDGLRHSNTWSR